MSYLALARKYRPQTFSEVLSQDFIISTLQNAINMGRVAHAYLLTGPRGVGKTSTARIFAKALNCLNPISFAPCGQCENCIEITSSVSLDVLEIDGASNRGVEEIRSLREAVKFVPIKSKYKIIIVDEVHMLTEPAFNALLKTLEEPPEYVIFIFATTDQHKVPVTILSRCQRYEFKKISYEEMNNNLKNILEKENIKYEPDALNYIIKNSDGCMRDALSLLDQVIAYSDGNITAKDTSYLLGISDAYLSDDLFSAIMQEKAELLPDLVEKIDEKGIDYKYMTSCLITHCRNMLIYSITSQLPYKSMTDKEIKLYSSLKEYADKSTLYAVFQIFTKLMHDLKYSDFARYVFEFAVIKAANVSLIINVLENNGQNNNIPNKSAINNNYNNTNSQYINNRQANNNHTSNKQIDNTQAQHIQESNINKQNIENNSTIWQKILNEAKINQQFLYGMIQHANIIKDSAEYLSISLPPNRQFQYNQLKTGSFKNLFENTVEKISGTNTKIEIILEDEKGDYKNDNIEKKSENSELIINKQENTKQEDIKNSYNKTNGVENQQNDSKIISNEIERNKGNDIEINNNKINNEEMQKLKEEIKDNEFLKMAESELGSKIVGIKKY